uniref:Uncharacterized protein n=1 Tax=Rhizophora mucronata TaxID=61149 RepID=A0A2P2PTJ0_RHIMU
MGKANSKGIMKGK